MPDKHILPLLNKEKLEESVRRMDEKNELGELQRAPESLAPRTGGWKTSPYILGTLPDLESLVQSICLPSVKNCT